MFAPSIISIQLLSRIVPLSARIWARAINSGFPPALWALVWTLDQTGWGSDRIDIGFGSDRIGIGSDRYRIGSALDRIWVKKNKSFAFFEIVHSVETECSLLWNGCSLGPQLGLNVDPLPETIFKKNEHSVDVECSKKWQSDF